MSEPTVVTEREAFLVTAAEAPDDARIPVEVTVQVTDPFDAYRRARTESTETGDSSGFYFETTGGQSGWGYFGVDPEQLLSIRPDEAAFSVDASPTLDALDEVLERETLVRGACDVPYPCGVFGWLSYDLARELETLPASTTDDRELPHLQVGVFDRVAAWEEPRDGDETTLRVTACPRVGDDPERAYRRGLRRARALAAAALSGDPGVGDPPTDAEAVRFESTCGREAYEDRVRAVKRYVRDGDTFQANVSHRLSAPAAVHPVEAFAALREVNPAPYSALVEFPGVDLVSASPELLLDVDGDRLTTEPIAGTRPRGATTAEDDRLAADLLGDEKERAEHAMLVDLERNDLGKVAEYGSVGVTDYRRVDRYSAVMHLVSIVEATRRPGTSVADAVAALFPGGTITGAPKPRTMEIIDELETHRRGPYTGSIAAFGFDDRATCNITIRTLVRHDDAYHLRVGAGIVHDSVPEREYDETLAKARALITAVDEALGNRGRFEMEVER